MAPKYVKPTVTVVGITLQGGNLLKQNFLVTFNVVNPNDRSLPVNSLHAELRISGDPVATGDSSRAFVVPPRGQQQFDMTVTANIALALLKYANQRNQHDSQIPYELTGTATVDLPFIRDIPFDQHGTLPLSF